MLSIESLKEIHPPNGFGKHHKMKTKTQPFVLLVEDEIVTAECYKGYLENEPINLVHLDTGDAALLYLQQATPAAFLLDLAKIQ